MESGKLWMVFSIGAIAGATVALVCAPQSGTRTRKQIQKNVRDAGESLQSQVEDAGGYLRKQASTLSDQATKAYKKGKKQASSASDDLMDGLQSAVQSVKGSIS